MDWLNNALLSAPLGHHSKPSTLSSTFFPEQLWYAYSGQRSQSNTLWVWLHGWGQSHEAFLPLLQQCEDFGDHLIVDFPGFGRSPLPPLSWGTKEYADNLNALIQRVAPHNNQIIFIGHSFGCRVALQYCTYFPNKLKGMVFIAGAGLKEKLSSTQRTRRFLIKTTLRFAKQVDHLLPTHCADRVRHYFGSSDYLKAGAIRPIFTRVVNEDLTELAKHATLPVLLLYGELDTATPPEFGARYHSLMPQSTLHILSDFDHHTILTHARYHIKRYIFDWSSLLKSTPDTTPK